MFVADEYKLVNWKQRPASKEEEQLETELKRKSTRTAKGTCTVYHRHHYHNSSLPAPFSLSSFHFYHSPSRWTATYLDSILPCIAPLTSFASYLPFWSNQWNKRYYRKRIEVTKGDKESSRCRFGRETCKKKETCYYITLQEDKKTYRTNNQGTSRSRYVERTTFIHRVQLLICSVRRDTRRLTS